MLADFLEVDRERLVDEVHAEEVVPPGCEVGERRARLSALVDELIERLRHGSVDDRQHASSVCASDSEEREREQLRRAVLAEVDKRRLEVSLAELVIVSEWSCAVERSRLRDENRRFRALLDAVDDGMLLGSPDGRILYVNRRAADDIQQNTSLTLDRIVGKTSAEITSPSDLGRRMDELMKRAGAGEMITEDLLVPADAGERWMELKLTPVYGPDGTIGAVAGVGRDVHERKLAQLRFQLLAKMSSLVGLEREELLESIARLAIPELADWGAVDLVEGEQIRRSFLAQRDPAKAKLRDALSRFRPYPLSGERWRELRAGRAILISELSEAALRERAIDEHHFHLLASVGARSGLIAPIRSGDQVSALLTFVTTSESGRHYGLDDLALAEELARRAGQIIENARLHDELKRSEARFRVALAAGRIIVYEQDANLRFQYLYNPARDEDSVGKNHADLFDADQAARLDVLKRRALAGERVRDEVDLSVGGAHRHIREAIEPVRDASGSVVGVIGAVIDITAEKRAQAELAQAVTFREQMIGILGHDLRNPLGAILMAVELLRGGPELPERARDQARRIDHAAQRMVEMIGTLLDFAQVRFRGALPVSPVPTDLGELAREAVEELRTAWPDRRIDLELRGDPRGHWDPARIEQVISNLVANALTHGGNEAAVQLLVEGDGTEVRLTVRNAGPVIPTELIPMLFEPFRRGTDAHRSKGIGLGLYIARQIVEAHDGSIEVTSALGDGTRFSVHLPRAPGLTLGSE